MTARVMGDAPGPNSIDHLAVANYLNDPHITDPRPVPFHSFQYLSVPDHHFHFW